LSYSNQRQVKKYAVMVWIASCARNDDGYSVHESYTNKLKEGENQQNEAKQQCAINVAIQRVSGIK